MLLQVLHRQHMGQTFWTTELVCNQTCCHLTADEACNLSLGGRLVDVRIAAYLVDPDCKNAHDDHADSSSKAEKRLEKLVAELSSSSAVAQVAGVLGRCTRTMATSGGLPGTPCLELT